MKRRNKGIPSTTADKHAVREAAGIEAAIASCPPAVVDDAGTGRSTWRDIFANQYDAVAFLHARGFSVGRMQGPERRGILFGEYDIQKWRNLSAKDQAVLHGVVTITSAARTAAVTIFASAPDEAHAAIRSHRARLSDDE